MANITAKISNSQSHQNMKQNVTITIKQSAMSEARSAFGEIKNTQSLLQHNPTTNHCKLLSVKQTAVVRQNTSIFQKEPQTDVGKVFVSDSSVAKAVCASVKQPHNAFDLASKPNVEDIDKNDAEQPQLCSEFVNDIYQYIFYLETKYPIHPDYLKDTRLKPRMRCILVDWLIQVHHRFQLLQETLYLTVAILDRFLQALEIPRGELQLVGVAANAPKIFDFVYITDKTFSEEQILGMEASMLKTLEFSFGRPLPLHFLRRNSKAGQVALQHTLAKNLMELSLVDYDMCHVSPSKLAAGALCLSLKLLDDFEWVSRERIRVESGVLYYMEELDIGSKSATLEHYSTYSEDVLQPVVSHLAKNLQSASTNTYQHAVKSKYSRNKLMKLSEIKEVKVSLVDELAERAKQMKL